MRVSPVNGFIKRMARAGWAGPIDHAGGLAWRRKDGLAVITGWATDGGEKKVHVSASYAAKRPTDEDMTEVRRLFLAPDRPVEEVEDGSKNPNVRHLFVGLKPKLGGEGQ